jgi:site-specific DNA recombinase
VYSREHLGCFGARGRGTCTNRLTIPRQEVEERVLGALKEKLMRKDFFEEFCSESKPDERSWWRRACLAPRSKTS